jgi:hypothetical protein
MLIYLLVWNKQKKGWYNNLTSTTTTSIHNIYSTTTHTRFNSIPVNSLTNYPTQPCKDCSKRHARCHSKCNEYAAYKTQINKYNLLKKKEKAFDTYCVLRYIDYQNSKISKR